MYSLIFTLVFVIPTNNLILHAILFSGELERFFFPD